MLQHTGGIANQVMAWADLAHSQEWRPLILPPALVHKAFDIPLGLPAKRQKSLGFRCNKKSIVLKGIKQWLNTIAISGGNESLGFGIVNADGEFPSEMFEKRETVEFIERNSHLTVTGAPELVVGFARELFADAI